MREIILILMVIGSYDLLLCRNSLFSYIFVVLLYIIYEQGKPYWYIPLIGFWGCIHGSYLLGFVLIFLILVGDLIERASNEDWL